MDPVTLVATDKVPLARSASTTSYAATVAELATYAHGGTTTNDNAAAGQGGEYLTATLASGSAITLTNNVVANVTSISLTPGDWDVTGIANLAAIGTASSVAFGITATSATLPTPGGMGYFQLTLTGSPLSTVTIPMGMTRFSLAVTTTVYLVAVAGFTTGTTTSFGTIRARRMR